MKLFAPASRRRKLSRKSRRIQESVSPVQALENRVLLVGNVRALVSGNDLFITGENSSNALEITVLDGDVVIKPKQGVRLNGIRGRLVAFQGTDTIPGKVVINLKQGDDQVVLSGGLTVDGNVYVKGQRGQDTLALDNVTVNGQLVYNGGQSDDSLSMDDSTVARATSIRMRGGDDLIRMNDSTTNGHVHIATGLGDNSVFVNNNDAARNVRIKGRRGSDTIEISESDFDAHLRVQAFGGNDVIRLRNTDVAKRTSFRLGLGDDDLILGEGDGSDTTPAFGNVFQRGFAAIGGPGTDSIEVDIDTEFRMARFETGIENDVSAASTAAAISDAEDLRADILDLINARTETLTATVANSEVMDSNGLDVTDQERVTVRGSTTPNSTINVDSDGDGDFDDATADAGPDGSYSVRVPIEPGEQTISVQSTDERDNEQTADDLVVHRATGTVVRLSTNQGDIDIELLNDPDDETSPEVTVANFLRYFDRYGNNTLINRSVDNFIIQGGGFTFDETQPIGNRVSAVEDFGTIPNEFNAANSNLRGTLSMALPEGQPDGGTSEWFINLADNVGLDTPLHTVFGRVIGGAEGPGMDVADAINNLVEFDLADEFNSATSEIPVNDADFDVAISGTVTATEATTSVTGVDTSFLSELSVGDDIRIGAQWVNIVSIDSDTSLVVDEAFEDSTTGSSAITRGDAEDLTLNDLVFFNSFEQILNEV